MQRDMKSIYSQVLDVGVINIMFVFQQFQDCMF